ncbi:MAG: aminotransferase class III-fold pyridoxal phosphate-dependent enzyme [Bacteroidetes bacterium]|nr:MAG: aminotransferase class III-fold pyridoxal phosphate-dependent enzyme [Bacteroidota bacterium]
MKLFDVYPLYELEPVRAEGAYVYDREGRAYLDFYGGHAVISIGHSHPRYVQRIQEQVAQIGFYSNSVQNALQEELADKLGRLSGCEQYQLFLCNSGAEANENALKLASFATGRKQIVVFQQAFHGRTSAAVNITDNAKIKAPINTTFPATFLPLNDEAALRRELAKGEVAAVMVEGIQGIGGIYVPEPAFLELAQELCRAHGAVLILDEIQSGYGRSGKFFAYQYANIEPDLITVAKGMGNGFPIGGVLIHPKHQPRYGLLGTTFGGNHLACAAGIAVLDVIAEEKLMDHAAAVGSYLLDALSDLTGIVAVRGKGLMIGVELDRPAAPLRKQLLFEEGIFTGSAAQANTIRLLPPLNITLEQAECLIAGLRAVLS